MHDDLDKTLHDSLDQHAAAVGRPTGEIDDVFTRVDQRRSRRRAVAVIGSVAAVGVGVLGIVAVGAGGGSDAPAAGDQLDGDAGSNATASAAGGGWACTGEIGGDGTWTYYKDCQPLPFNAEGTAVVCVSVPYPEPTTTIYTTTTYIVDTVPATTVPAEQVYTVTAGDSLSSIARPYGLSADDLAAYNAWPEGVQHPIFEGDSVRIPPGVIAPVQPWPTTTAAGYTTDATAYTQECWPADPVYAPATTVTGYAVSESYPPTTLGFATDPYATAPQTTAPALTATTAP